MGFEITLNQELENRGLRYLQDQILDIIDENNLGLNINKLAVCGVEATIDTYDVTFFHGPYSSSKVFIPKPRPGLDLPKDIRLDIANALKGLPIENPVENEKFGRDELRKKKLEKLHESGMKEFNSVGNKELKNILGESLCQHIVGYLGNPERATRILLGICIEDYPSILDYLVLKIGSKLLKNLSGNVKARLVLPSYEFHVLGISNKDIINQYRNYLKKILPNKIEFIDTLENKEYLFKRLDLAYLIQNKYINIDTISKSYKKESFKPKLATKSIEIADIILSLKEDDTLLISNYTSLHVVKEAKRIAKKLGIDNQLAVLFYIEPLSLNGKERVLSADNSNKILLNGDPKESRKIFRAKTSGKTLEDLVNKGGDYHNCIVAETCSILLDEKYTSELKGKCSNGLFKSCQDCKQECYIKLKYKLKEIAENLNNL